MPLKRLRAFSEKLRQPRMLFLPDPSGYHGGPASFLRNLVKYMMSHHIQLTHDSRAKISTALVPISYPLDEVRRWKKNGVHIVQRLDGIYYPSKHGERYEDLNALIKEIYKNYASSIIFQSEYSKNQCYSIFGPHGAKQEFIVHNGADTDYFFPSESILSPPMEGESWKLVTTGSFRNSDMIEPLTEAMDILIKEHMVELEVIGDFKNKELEKYLQRSYIRHVGKTNLPEIASRIKKSHIFLYSHLNPPCPNSVIEAVQCGLPVVGFDSGAMRELLSHQTELLASVNSDVIQKYEDFDPKKLAEKIIYSMKHYIEFAQKSRDYASRYSLNKMGSNYMEILNEKPV